MRLKEPKTCSNAATRPFQSARMVLHELRDVVDAVAVGHPDAFLDGVVPAAPEKELVRLKVDTC